MMGSKPATIAVVGAGEYRQAWFITCFHLTKISPGPAGVSALKSLLDEGFDVTAFERRPNVGGVWTQSEHPDHVSTINCTTYQTSKFSCPISDYPVPDGKTLNN